MEQKNLSPLERVKILYVEDEQEAREELCKYLKRRVGKIVAAENGLAGLSLYKEFEPDIIIVDLFMPKMDGIEMVQEIRKADQECHVIVTTAVSDVDVILKSVDAGINKYLLKPINPLELLAALKDAAEKRIEKKAEETMIDGENKKRLEDDIKREFSAFLKGATGKGPRDVVVLINGGSIELTAYDTLTVMEKSMLDSNKNIAVVEQNRKLFYSIKENGICEMLTNILKTKVRMKYVEVNAEKGTNKLRLEMYGKGQRPIVG